MTLTAENVETVFMNCLFLEGEDTSQAKIVKGIVSEYGFHPQRLESYKVKIAEMLGCLPDEFREDKGGGWSFLNACNTKDGYQWGEHRNIEQLLALGIATQQAKMLLPREMWHVLPGGMPYFVTFPKSFENLRLKSDGTLVLQSHCLNRE